MEKKESGLEVGDLVYIDGVPFLIICVQATESGNPYRLLNVDECYTSRNKFGTLTRLVEHIYKQDVNAVVYSKKNISMHVK